MSAEFVHLSPVIMSDDMWETYQPALSYDARPEQRQAAYLWAEQKMIEALRTPLLPTTITGTFAWPFNWEYIRLPHVYVRSVDQVVARARDSGCSCDLTDYDGCALIRGNQGYVSVIVTENVLATSCGGRVASVRPWEVEIAYTAGLSTGTAATDTSLHMALTMLSRIQLLRMIDPGALEGGMGDPGIVSYSGPGYSETRTKESVKRTPFGNSAIANAAWGMVEHLYLKRSLRL